MYRQETLAQQDIDKYSKNKLVFGNKKNLCKMEDNIKECLLLKKKK